MSTPNNPMSAVEQRTKALAEARETVATIVTALNDGIEALQRQHMGSLKKAIQQAAEKHDQLKAQIEANPEIFSKPKTVVIHGIKVGLKKAPGRMEFEDADAVVRRIEKLLPDQAEVLVVTDKRPSKEALALLPAADLKRLGVTVSDSGDAVVIAPVDSHVDKLVRALLKTAIDEKEGA